ncbi:unnamed protein product, partial [Protopolystoma xenopodis]
MFANVLEYKANACEAITFKLSMTIYFHGLVRTVFDVTLADSFKPEMTHQIFGPKEIIFGYKNLSVNILCLAGSLETFVDTEYASKISTKLAKGTEPHDILESLTKSYEFELIKTRADFESKVIQEIHFKPFGTVRNKYTSDNGSKSFSIYYIEPGMEDFEEFKVLHKRMQSFLPFFVDGASFIDSDDSQWCYYTLYESYFSEMDVPCFAFVGFMTVYKFYAYPESIRPRISQVLILPPFQKQGHGTQFVQTFYNDFVPVSKVLDIA